MSNSALLILLKGQACIQDTQLKGNLSFTDSHNLNRHIELHVHGCEVMTQKSLVHYAIRSFRTLWAWNNIWRTYDKMSVAESNTILIERFSLDPKKYRINPADIFSDVKLWTINLLQINIFKTCMCLAFMGNIKCKYWMKTWLTKIEVCHLKTEANSWLHRPGCLGQASRWLYRDKQGSQHSQWCRKLKNTALEIFHFFNGNKKPF